MRILVSCLADKETNDTFYTPRVRAELEKCGKTEYGIYTEKQLAAALSGTDILFANWGVPRLGEELLSRADSLKLVCYTGGSVACLADPALERRGIRVLSGNRIYARSVAEGTIGYMLLAQRRLPRMIRETEENGWAPQYYTEGLCGKTVGLIGFGMVSRCLAEMLRAFGCRVLVCSKHFTAEDARRYSAESCSLPELLAASDIVSLHEALRESTRHTIGESCFAAMKPGALFVNTARGAIVAEDDLARAARAGKIRAVLDVFETEPLPMDSPLRGCSGITLIPHRAGPTIDARETVTLSLIADVKRFLSGTAKLENEISYAYAKHMTAE